MRRLPIARARGHAIRAVAPANDAAHAPRDDAPSRPLTLESVYRDHAAAVSRWAARLGGPGADVEDLVHDVFVIVQRKLDDFRPDAKITTWLYRITERVVLNRRRRDRFRRLFFGSGSERAGAEIPFSGPDQLAALEQREEIANCYQILDRLSESDRALLVLFEIEDLGGEQIAELLGVKLGTVWVRLHRARLRFLGEARRHEKTGVGLVSSEVGHVGQRR